MASGASTEKWVGKAAACPPEWPIGAVVVLNDKEYVCLDRGGKIQYNGDLPWIDFLERDAQYVYGTPISVTLKLQVLSVDYLRTSPVNGTQRQGQVQPLTEIDWDLIVPEGRIHSEDTNTESNGNEHRNIPLEYTNWYIQLPLKERLNLIEQALHERALHEPVYSDHNQPVLQQDFQNFLK